MRKGTARRDVPTAPTPAPAAGGRAGSFFVELRRRNVFRMAGLYLVAGWLVVQVAETLLPLFGTPAWVLKAVIVLLALGFVPTLVFSWVYELTPGGLVRETAVARDASIVDRTARKLDVATMALLVAVATLVVWQRMQPTGPEAGITPAAEATGVTGAATAARPMDAGSAPPAAPAPPAASIAVLPFVNMSGDAADEYFSDGITEEILNALTRIEGLKVAGRTSSFRFKGRNEDLKAIGAALGVAHVLEGSVRKQGDVVRITAQLVKVEDGFHVWSQNYERTLVDIFAVQDEISAAIAGTLAGKLVVAPAGTEAGDIDAATFDVYLRARQALAAREIPKLREAADLFAIVTTDAPRFAPGWAGRAKAQSLLFNYAGGVLDNTTVDASIDAAHRALALDPANGEALSLLASTLAFYRWDTTLDEALATARQAAAVAPNEAEVANFVGDTYRFVGAFEEALTWERRAVELDPLFPVNHTDHAWILLTLDRPREALVACAHALRIDPTFWTAQDIRVRAFLELGDVAAATAEFDTAAPAWPDVYQLDELRARLALAAGDPAAARPHIDALYRRDAAGETISYTLASVLALLDDHAATAKALEKALAQRDPGFAADPTRVRPSDWPDDPAIQAVFARPELARLYAARERNGAGKTE